MSFQVGDIVRLRSQAPLECVCGVVEKVGIRQTRVNFVRMPWTPSDAELPEMREFPHDQLVKCRDPWSDAASGKWSTPEELRLRLRAAELWLANAHGQLGNARTDLLPHQVCLVHEVVERSPRRLMIAEEVGMGKTIETGMIVHALMERRELERCLVICPAGQIRQWQEELEEKLRVRFEVYRHDIDGKRAFSFPMVIASLDTAKLDKPSKQLGGKSHREILLEAPDWDLVVFDEAHRLTAKDYGSKTEKTLNYRLAEQLCERTRDFLFLTGTPHDGNDSKFRNLLKALDPEVVFTVNEPGRFFGNLILKNRKSEAISAEGLKLFKKVGVEKVACHALDSGEKQFHEALNVYLREGYGVADSDPDNPKSRAIGFVMTTFQKLATSSVAAVRKSLAKRLKLLEGDDEEEEQPRPGVGDERFEGENTELELERLQSEQLRDAFAEMEVGMLRELVDFKVPQESKWLELQRLVREISATNADEKFLIFTEYRGTVAFLEGALQAGFGGDTTVTIMGGMSADERRETIARFKSDCGCRFLISTEAGGEGINLQFCNLVVNYDRPWNPFRLVQRIGRVHRIGQGRNMKVFNLQLRNDLDERLSGCHEDRVDTAVDRLTNITGWNVEDIRDQLLGFAQEFINYDQIYRDALKDSSVKQSEEEIAQGIKEAEKAFVLAYETVFKHSVAPFNPDRFRELMGSGLQLEDLRAWVESYLKLQGRRLMRREAEDLWEFLVPDSLKDKVSSGQRTVKGTFDRARAMKDSELEFLAFGHPLIELLLRSALGPNAGGGVAAADGDAMGSVVGRAWALLREDQHTAAAAFRLLVLEWDNDRRVRLISNDPGIIPASGENRINRQVQSERTLAPLFDFLADQFPDSDFIEDRVHWLGVLINPEG